MIGVRRKNEKYVIVASWPIITYGSSTGRAPIHVRINHLATIVQNMSWAIGLNEYLVFLLVLENGRIRRISSAIARAITPPNLFGIERRIA